MMSHFREAVVGAGGRVLSVVFDGMYVVSASDAPIQEIMQRAALWVERSLGATMSCKMLDDSFM